MARYYYRIYCNDKKVRSTGRMRKDRDLILKELIPSIASDTFIKYECFQMLNFSSAYVRQRQ